MQQPVKHSEILEIAFLENGHKVELDVGLTANKGGVT